MAISIEQQPRPYGVAGHPVVIGLSSDNSAEDGFRFRVHIEMSLVTDHVTLFVPPQGAVTKIDIRSLLDNRLNDVLSGTIHSQAGGGIYGDANDSINTVSVSVTEWWLVDGILTEADEDQESCEFVVVNGHFDNKTNFNPDTEGSNTDYAFNLNGNTKRFFSDRKFNTHIWDRAQSFSITPSAQTIFIPSFESDYGVLSFCNNNSQWMTSNPIDKIQVTIYAANGAPTAYTETIGGGGEPLANAFVYPANLNASTATGIVKPSNYPNWRFYTVRALDSSNAAVSALYVFYNAELYGQSDCKHNKVRLAWQNSRGGWDYFNFIKKNEESLNIERTTFRKLRGYDTGGNFDYGAYEAGTTIQAVKATKSLTVTSDWISENEFIFLQSLLVSRQVHWLQDDGTFYPVVIDNTDYTLARERNGKLKNLNLKLAMANQYV
jgi:hypothetical protein